MKKKLFKIIMLVVCFSIFTSSTTVQGFFVFANTEINEVTYYGNVNRSLEVFDEAMSP